MTCPKCQETLKLLKLCQQYVEDVPGLEYSRKELAGFIKNLIKHLEEKETP